MIEILELGGRCFTARVEVFFFLVYLSREANQWHESRVTCGFLARWMRLMHWYGYHWDDYQAIKMTIQISLTT